MNTNLKKLAKGKSGRTTVLNVVLALVIVLCLFVLVAESAGKSDSSAEPYTLESSEGDRAYIDVQYMSEYFASFTSKEADKLYFVLDENLGAYIVCFTDSEAEKYQNIQAYTFGETNVAPEIVRTYGKLVPLDDEIMELAIEEFNWFWGEDVVTKANFYDIFGSYYLDTAVTEVSGTPYVLVAVIIASAVTMVLLTKKKKGLSSVSKQTLAVLAANGEADMVDAELQDIRTQHMEQIGVYLTDNYLVSDKNGLIVIPLRTLAGLYGVITEKTISLIARDMNGTETEFVIVQSGNNKLMEHLNVLVKAISAKVPGLEYGLDRVKAEEEIDIYHVGGFFMTKDGGSSLEVQHDMTNPDGTIVTPNMGLGIVGSLVGAFIGGLLWFGIGNLGYIAGIVGFVIIYLSALGFKKGAKVLTKTGAVISVIISMLTILAANYMLYAWQLTKAFEGRYTLMECISMLPTALKDYEMTGSFVKDIVIGYAFTILAAFSTLRTMFGKKKK